MERKQVTVGSRRRFLDLFCVISLLAVLGCVHKLPANEEINHQIDVFGIRLFSTTDYREFRGVTPEKEPCLKGYEYFFDPLDISIGYTPKGSIRKITTRNRETSMFLIRVGDPFAQGRDRLLQAGFQQGDTPYRFVKGWCSMTLLVDTKGQIFGMTAEVLD